jgi:glutamine phosphoribosylpyrophosphate amidotransferase
LIHSLAQHWRLASKKAVEMMCRSLQMDQLSFLDHLDLAAAMALWHKMVVEAVEKSHFPWEKKERKHCASPKKVCFIAA